MICGYLPCRCSRKPSDHSIQNGLNSKLNEKPLEGCPVNLRELLHLVARCFNENGIPYFVTGSVASFIYGEPRLTQDIDIVAAIREKNIPGLLYFFPEEEFYLDRISVQRALRERSQFNIIHPSSGLKVDVIIPKKNEFDQLRFERRKNVSISEELMISYSSPEDLIVSKLEFYQEGGSEKHLRDIAGIIKISGGELDFDYLAVWMERKGLGEIWNDFLRKIGKKP